jgi:hypothetical protein
VKCDSKQNKHKGKGKKGGKKKAHGQKRQKQQNGKAAKQSLPRVLLQNIPSKIKKKGCK